MPAPRVAILGASRDPSRPSHQSLLAHLRAGYEVFPVNPNTGQIAGVPAWPSLDQVPEGPLDRVSIYLPSTLALAALDQVANRQVREVWINPGADAPDVIEKAHRLNLNVITGCSLLDAQSRKL